VNLFVLTNDHGINARWHFNSHVVKMPLEAAQLMCTARHVLGGSCLPIQYKPTHKNHPCAKWVRKSYENYMWTYQYGKALCNEYQYRYGREHACLKVLEDCLLDFPLFDSKDMTPFTLAMPDEFKSGSAFLSYKLYYMSKKESLHKWKDREIPYWFESKDLIKEKANEV